MPLNTIPQAVTDAVLAHLKAYDINKDIYRGPYCVPGAVLGALMLSCPHTEGMSFPLLR